MALGAPASLPAAATSVATLEVLAGGVEVRRGGSWRRTDHGARVATGDVLRTTAGGLARLRFPWMSLALAPDTEVALASSRILALRLERGRLEQSAERGILKLRTAEAEVRGQGHVVLRRERGRTLVSVLKGSFRLTAGGDGMGLEAGQGAVVESRRKALGPLPLAQAPVGLQPSADPAYVARGTEVALSWTGGGARNHLQVFAVGAERITRAFDVGGETATLEAPVLGTFRWRVAALDGQGLEGLPSADGAFCVVER